MEKLQFIFLVILGLSTTVRGAKYGEGCSNTIPCVSNITDPLVCSTTTGNGICVCLPDMIRDPSKNQCVSGHDKVCTIAAGDGLPIRECTQFAECWPNPTPAIEAIRVDGKCHCDRNDTTADTTTGLCKLTYGSARCTKETDCDVLKNFICRGNKCVCQDEEFQKYNGERCTALVGGSCVAQPPYVAAPCGENMKCNAGTKVCECDGADLEPTPDKTCSKGFNKTCDPLKKECHPDFECHETDKRCVCPAGLIPHADGTCRILIGKNCNNTNYRCIGSSECNDINGICTCPSDSTPSANNTQCLGLYGVACNDTSPCYENDFLRCTDGSCKCTERYDNDDLNKICKGWLNSQCPTAGNDQNCAGSLVCKVGTNGNNVCQCPERYEPSGDNQCVGKHGASCIGGETCSSDLFLSCNAGGACDCSDPSKYLHEAGAERCVAMANGECTSSPQCVTNSTCTAGNPSTCACISKHTANKEGRCVPGGANSIVASSALLAIAMMAVVGKYY